MQQTREQQISLCSPGGTGSLSAGISLHLLLSFNSDGEQSVNPESLDIGLGEVLVELPQVEDGQHDAEQIDQNPDSIEDIVPVGALR